MCLTDPFSQVSTEKKYQPKKCETTTCTKGLQFMAGGRARQKAVQAMWVQAEALNIVAWIHTMVRGAELLEGIVGVSLLLASAPCAPESHF